ncbi:MAG TPA: M28 family peptidase, partial [Planctomycetota bacterium]|nr:M28 family peptidase [Planctomycetota bacterium]
AFVKAGPFDPKSFAALICMDLVGGDFYPGDSRGLYALGAESGLELRELVLRQAARESDLEVRSLGIYAIEPMGPLLPRSDYASFRSVGVPFVFFSTGTPWYYHTPHDDTERINFEKLQFNVRLIVRVLAALADAPVRPVFVRSPRLPEGDAEVFAAQMERILANPGLAIEPEERDRLGTAAAELRKLSDAGVEAKVKGLIQRSIVTLLGIVQRSRPEK